MGMVTRADLVTKGLKILARRTSSTEMMVANAEVAKAYAKLAEALGNDSTWDAQ